MNNSAILKSLLASDKDIIIYRNSEKNNFELYTDFIEKISLNINNLDKFLNKLDKFKAKKKYDCYIGFFGYELLCKNLNLTVNKDNQAFPEGVFFRPQTKIVIDSKIDIFTKSKLDLIKSIKPLKKSKNTACSTVRFIIYKSSTIVIFWYYSFKDITLAIIFTFSDLLQLLLLKVRTRTYPQLWWITKAKLNLIRRPRK